MCMISGIVRLYFFVECGYPQQYQAKEGPWPSFRSNNHYTITLNP